MKSHPHLILDALRALNAEASESIVTGDSRTDITASRKAGVHVVEYANKLGKSSGIFQAADADAVVTSLADVVAAL